MDEGNRLAESALLWLGTPYHHNAKIRGVGVDCARFVIGACEDAGLLEKDSLVLGDYSNEWALHHTRDVMHEVAEKYGIQVKNPRRGDIFTNMVVWRVMRVFIWGMMKLFMRILTPVW